MLGLVNGSRLSDGIRLTAVIKSSTMSATATGRLQPITERSAERLLWGVIRIYPQLVGLTTENACGGWPAGEIALPHRVECAFQVAHETQRVEQRQVFARGQCLAQAAQFRWVLRLTHRGVLAIFNAAARAVQPR